MARFRGAGEPLVPLDAPAVGEEEGFEGFPTEGRRIRVGGGSEEGGKSTVLARARELEAEGFGIEDFRA